MGFDKKIVRCADDVKDCFAALYGECSAAQLARYEKLIARFKAETGKTPGDKENLERYNSDSNLFVGRSLQEE